MKNKSLLILAAVATAAATLSGCIDIQQSVSLQRDLSGTASVDMSFDMEPMIVFMAGMQHSLSGKEGDPTPAEIAAARKSFLDEHKKDAANAQQHPTAEEKAQFEQGLPPGVKLLSTSVDDQGTRVAVHCRFGFDDVRKLAKISLANAPVPDKLGGGQSSQSPVSDPFSNLQVTDEGPTLLLTMKGANPTTRLQEQVANKGADTASPEMGKAIAGAFAGARFAFRLESPFEVVSTNATRREGRALIWEVRGTDPDAKLPDTLTARFKK